MSLPPVGSTINWSVRPSNAPPESIWRMHDGLAWVEIAHAQALEYERMSGTGAQTCAKCGGQV